MYKVYILLLCAILFAGCSKGPNENQVKKHIQQKLDQEFQSGLFKIEYLKRKGTYPYLNDTSFEEQRLIYFRTEISFLKDYKLSNWDGLNMGSLISILGSTPLGIKGVHNKGNKKGDKLLVYGTTAYGLKDKKWTRLDHHTGILSSKKQDSTSSGKYVNEMEEDNKRQMGAKPLYEQYLSEISNIARSLEKQKDKKFLQDQLASVLRHATFKLAKEKGWITIATGSKLAEYYAIGTALADLNPNKDKIIKAYPSSGSVENCNLVEKNSVLFAFSQNDIACMAYNGTGLFKNRPALTNLRALCSLYPETVQIIARKKSNIKSIKDLAGKKVNIGSKGSGIRINALQILETANFGIKNIAKVYELSVQKSVEAFTKGEIDVLFITSAYPVGLVQDLAISVPIRMVSLDKKHIKKLTKKYPFFIPVEISQKAYAGVQDNVSTVGVTAMLITHKDTPENDVKLLLNNIFKNTEKISQQSIQANYITLKNARKGLSIELHKAAKKFFKNFR